MTQREFNQLPLALKSGDVGRILGMEWHEVKELARRHPELLANGVKVKHLRFQKKGIAKLAGLEFE